ncbi:hypothetical protein Aglo03_03900 [Actinokineospora globicatena]|uniref:Uncharacterized protein n=1 Tax=Actinokineospora globicatena TaxID=103729 RepID=A0A9W6QJC8_9PSEU|nr:hypothetical protein Aglo03_03900 [Actinokineospora globicatena]
MEAVSGVKAVAESGATGAADAWPGDRSTAAVMAASTVAALRNTRVVRIRVPPRFGLRPLAWTRDKAAGGRPATDSRQPAGLAPSNGRVSGQMV